MMTASQVPRTVKTKKPLKVNPPLFFSYKKPHLLNASFPLGYAKSELNKIQNESCDSRRILYSIKSTGVFQNSKNRH